MFPTLSKAAKEIERLREEVRAAAKSAGEKEFAPAFKKFFKDHPEIKQISWTQYTPYFNDGDECVFGVHDLEFNTESKESDEYGDGLTLYSIDDAEGQKKYGVRKATYEALKEIEESIQTLGDLLKDVFGDHSRIVVTEKSIEVESYEHD